MIFNPDPTPAEAARRAALLAQAKELPPSPGVYLFRDADRAPVYIGKASSLRARVSSYFRPRAHDGRMLFNTIVASTHDLEFITVDTPKAALLLENALIKKEKPRFNILLTDDKTYPSIKVSVEETWPRVRVVRKARKDGAQYFGPYASPSGMRAMLRLLRKHFPLRTCSNAEFRQRTRPCIEYDMGRCGAPCVKLQTEQDYRRIVEDVLLFLRGRNDELRRRLETRMKEHAARLEFEQAAVLRDDIRSIQETLAKQGVARTGVDIDQDVFGLARIGARTVVRVIFVRSGQINGATEEVFEAELGEQELLNSFLGQFYDLERPIPTELLLPFPVEDQALLSELLSERRGRKVSLKVPQRGPRATLVAMATKNAAAYLNVESRRREARREALDALARQLALPCRPESIECCDISTIQGSFTVASIVRFEGGEPAKARYRKYKVTTVDGQDDFASMREVLSRRFGKGERDLPFPNLFVVDGGKGQLSIAQGVFAELGIPADRVALIGLAKARATPGRSPDERIFIPGQAEPLVLDQDSVELRTLAHIRNEAHRFAITYHRKLRRKRLTRSGLEEIPGVGGKRRRLLLQHFGKLRAIREASERDLAALPGIPVQVAKAIHEFFREQEDRAR